tara:strand:- start:717 stop:1562 length:846 start_codon:yes stop_codon:yes gene_type:complete
MEEVILRYDGESLSEHSMDIKLVAESLQGLETLVREVHEELGGKEEQVDIKVKGGFNEGSFEFLCTVSQFLSENIELLKIVGFGAPFAGGSLVSYLQWLKGRKIKRITLTEEGNCKIVTVDGETKESPSYMRALLASSSVRVAFNKVISKPLRSKGIELFQVLTPEQDRSEREVLASVTKDDERYFRQKQTIVEEIDSRKPPEEKVITFLSVHKDKDTGWRIDYDGDPLSVKVEDIDFRSRVSKGGEPDIFANAYTVDIQEIENIITLDKSYSIIKVYDPD